MCGAKAGGSPPRRSPPGISYYLGSVRLGSFSSVRFYVGPVRLIFVSFRFVSFRFVSIRFVSFRFVSFRLNSFRFGSVLVSFQIIKYFFHFCPGRFLFVPFI